MILLFLSYYFCVFQFTSVAQSCLPFVTPWTAARQASLSISNSWSLLKLMSMESVMHPAISSSVISVWSGMYLVSLQNIYFLGND